MPTPLPVQQLIRFHPRLNPRLWCDHRLRVGVRLKLMQTAIAFYRSLGMPDLAVKDIILTGSNAAYNYTRLSDVDVHLLVEFGGTTCPDLASNFFGTKKTLWNQTYHVTIQGHPVELYVEDTTEPVKANGIYSILHGHWLKTPSDTAPQRDDTAVQQKAQAYADEIDTLLAGAPTRQDINEMLSRLYQLRQNGLMAGGEFSVENLAYKVLRAAEVLQKLYDARVNLRDHELSLDNHVTDCG